MHVTRKIIGDGEVFTLRPENTNDTFLLKAIIPLIDCHHTFGDGADEPNENFLGLSIQTRIINKE